MKKTYLFILLASMLSTAAIAQNITPKLDGLEGYHDETIVQVPQKSDYQNKQKAIETSWLSPVSNWQNQGAFFQNPTYMRLFPDSGVFIIPDDGSAPISQPWHLVGTVFQPDEPFYELQTDGWLMNRFDRYDVDSVRFPYAYQRLTNQTMVNGVMTEIVDTAIVHYYQASNLDDWYMQNSENRFLLPNGNAFSVTELGPTDVTFTDTILLTADAATDTVFGEQISLGTIQLAIPDEVKSAGPNPRAGFQNAVGVSLVYKPMQSYAFGDTLVSFNDNAQPVEQLNNFGTVYYVNQGGAMVQEQYFNNTFVSNRQVRYGQDFGSLKGYLATMAFMGWNNDLFFDADFLVSVDNPSSVPSVADDLGLKAYPNPAKMGEEIILKLDKNASINNVTITMVDLLGNVVAEEFVSLGNNEYSLTTDNLAGGVYLINVNADNSASTVRVIIGQ
jgi:hypothetical protein